MNRSHVALGLLTALLSMSISSSLNASAHSPVSDWYVAKWPSADLSVDWRFVSAFPTGSGWRARVKEAASTWNAVSGSSMSFVHNSSDYSSFSGTSCASTEQKNGIHWGSIDGAGNTYAAVVLCSFYDAVGFPGSTTVLHDFQMKFDTAEDWHTTLLAPTGIDLLSVATHEFGHATGRGRTQLTNTPGGDGEGHLLNSTSYCDSGSGHHTMCKGYYPNSSWDRSLETHDKDTYQDAY